MVAGGNFAAAGPEFLLRYVFGEREMGPLALERDVADPADPRADLGSDTHDVIARDWFVIAGSFVVLLVCALVFFVIMSAFSNTGKTLGYALLGAVAVATGMDVLENVLVLWSTNPPAVLDWLRLPPRFWVVMPAAVATVKWCALVVAICAVPAAAFASSRVAVSYISRRLRHSNGPRWWDRVLVATPHRPSTELPNETEHAWRDAYFVPGADELLTTENGAARTATALCLSGGGIRSGCVAMGAMQTLSREPVGDEPARWADAPLLDEFDYIISVSGGGYTAGARLLAVQQDKAGGPVAALADRFRPGSPEFAFFRRRASYIADTPMALVRALGEVLKNLLASAAMVLLIAVIFGWVWGWFVARLPLAGFVPSRDGTSSAPLNIQALDHHVMAATVAIAIPIVFALVFGAAGFDLRVRIGVACCGRSCPTGC